MMINYYTNPIYMTLAWISIAFFMYSHKGLSWITKLCILMVWFCIIMTTVLYIVIFKAQEPTDDE